MQMMIITSVVNFVVVVGLFCLYYYLYTYCSNLGFFLYEICQVSFLEENLQQQPSQLLCTS